MEAKLANAVTEAFCSLSRLLVADLSFAVLLYSIQSLLFHILLWTIGWMFLTLTQTLSGLLYF